MCLVSLSIFIGVIGVGTFCIKAKLFNKYFSLVRFTKSSNVEPRKPLEFQVGITLPLSISCITEAILQIQTKAQQSLPFHLEIPNDMHGATDDLLYDFRNTFY